MAAAATESLAPAGSSTYSSNIYHVGDGTWDEGRDSFLLPNLMGLPFDVMRYNGMGNRFRGLAEYHTLILGHAILAVITFLFIVPLSIFIAKSYHRNGRLALKIHITLMVIATILVTVVFILGYFAVGPVRSLSNPHHGIGLAIYVLILIQAFYGWIVKCIEKGKVRDNLSIKLTLHQFLGRAIAILGFIQVALGLTLYGSPSYLFVLYALWGTFLVIVYLLLSYRHSNAVHRALLGFDDGSYVTTTSLSHGPDGRPQGHRFSGLEKAAAVVGLGAAAAALRRRMSNRHERTESQGPILHDRPPPEHMTPPGHRFEEKYTESGMSEVHDDHNRHTWRNRLLGGAAAVGGIAAMRRMFGGRRREDEYASDVSGYTQPPPQHRPPPQFQHQPNPSAVQFQDMEEGRPLYPPGGPSDFRPGTGYHSEYQQGPPGPHAGPSGQHHMAGAEPIRQDWARHHDGRSDMRSRMSEDEYTEYDEPEKKSRFGGLFAGLGALGAAGGIRHYFRRRKDRQEQEDVDDMRRHDDDDAHRFGQPDTPGRQHAPYTDNSPRRPGAGATDASLTERTDFASRPTAGGSSLPTMTAAGHPPPQNIPPPPVSTNMPPPPPIHRDDYSPSSSPGTPTRTGRAQRYSNQNRSNNVIHEPLGGPLAATAAGGMLSPPPVIPAAAGHSRPHSSDSMGVESPPVSVKVKMHNDGRHVTVRRLSEEEAARERERHRQDRYNSPLNVPHQNLQPSMSPPSGLGGLASGVASSAGYDTAGSGVTDFETNRRRRRAERARMQQERERGGGGTGAGRRTVEFE